jgi:hypothetical protein
MKYFIAIIALAFCFSTAYSQSNYNPTDQSLTRTVQVKVIYPFSIVNAQATTGSYYLPPVVNGTKRILNPLTDGGLYIFKICKQKGYDVAFTISGNNTNNGLTIAGEWYWTYNNPVGTGNFMDGAQAIIGTGWVWGPSSNSDATDPTDDNTDNGLQTVYAFMAVSQLDAQTDPSCHAGAHTFHIDINGSYTNL